MERGNFNHWVTQAVIDQICCRLIDITMEEPQERPDAFHGATDAPVPEVTYVENSALDEVSGRGVLTLGFKSI